MIYRVTDIHVYKHWRRYRITGKVNGKESYAFSDAPNLDREHKTSMAAAKLCCHLLVTNYKLTQ